MNPQETLYSIVNHSECDENETLKVQYYFSRFEEADRQFQLTCGMNDAIAGARRVRHARFHKELRTGDLITIRSFVAFDGPHMLTVVHEMYNSSSGLLAATAIDGYAPAASSAKVLRARFKDVQDPMPELANPQGLNASPAGSRPTLESVLSSDARICFRGTVLPRHIGTDGRVDDDFAIAAFAEGLPHLWEQTPMTRKYLTENNYGRTAAEMKLTWFSPLKVGDMFLIASAPTGLQSKSFTLRHHLFESRTKRLVAICDVVAMMMDLDSRNPVELPEEAAKGLFR